MEMHQEGSAPAACAAGLFHTALLQLLASADMFVLVCSLDDALPPERVAPWPLAMAMAMAYGEGHGKN